MKLKIWLLILVSALLFTCAGAQEQAEPGVLMLPESLTVISEEAFFGATGIDRVQLPEKILEIHSLAFVDSSLREINLPDSLTYIAPDAFERLTGLQVVANEGSYAWDWAVEHGFIVPELKLTGVQPSLTGAACEGDEIMWIARASGIQGTPSYRFTLFRDGESVLTQDFSALNYLSAAVDAAGAYSVTAECRDASGNTVSLTSAPLQVWERPAEVLSITADRAAAVPGELVTWKVSARYGTAPLSFMYELYCNGTLLSTQNYSAAGQCAFLLPTEGEYTLLVSCRDAHERVAALWSESLTAAAEELIIPEAPVLQENSSGAAFTDTAETAPVIDPQRLTLYWAPAEAADSYTIRLQTEQDGVWQDLSVLHDIPDCSAAFAQSLLAVPQRTVFRVALQSQGAQPSEERYCYFAVEPAADPEIDPALLVNGQSSLIWQQAHRYASSRSFSVASALPWQAVSSADWLTLQHGGDALTIAMQESSGKEVRTASVTISNGVNTVTISITQGTANQAPQVSNLILSTDKANPTVLPAGSLGLRWTKGGHPRTRLCVYEVTTGAGRWLSTSGTSTTLGENYFHGSFSTEKTYAIELKGYYSSSFATYEVASDALSSTYYIRFSAGGHRMTVNGQQTLHLHNILSQQIYAEASNIFTCTSSADWLTCSVSTSTDNQQSVTLTAQPNHTVSARQAALTFRCGSAEAVVTVSQDSMLPVIVEPASLSQSESSPTTLPMDLNLLDTAYYFFRYNGTSCTFEPFKNGVYGEAKTMSRHDNFGTYQVMLTTQDVAGTQKCRLTVTSGDRTATYYVRFEDSSVRYSSVIVDNKIYAQKTVNAAARTLTLPIKATTPWKVASDAAWLTPSAASGTSSTTSISLSIARNTTGTPRTGMLTFTSTRDESVARYIVQQAAADVIMLSYPGEDGVYQPYDPAVHCRTLYGSGGGTRNFRIYASGSCTVKSNAAWLTLSSDKETTLYLDKDDSFSLYYESNGSTARTGTVTVTCGDSTVTIAVMQLPGLGELTITAPSWADKEANATVIGYQDATFTWPQVRGADYYVLSSTSTDAEIRIEADGRSSYSCVMPRTWLDPDSGKPHRICLRACADNGDFVAAYKYCLPMLDDQALIGGESRQRWQGVSDIGESRSYVIQATGAWTAAADQTFVTISPVSGKSGDLLTVTVAENTGSERTAQVTVSVNGVKSTLDVTQHAFLAAKYPVLTTPVWSTRETAPTAVSADTPLDFTWHSEPQALDYALTLYRHAADGVLKQVAANRLSASVEAYSFTDVTLTEGELYSVEFSRFSERYGRTSTAYYFLVSGGESWVLADDQESCTMEVSSTHDHEWFAITSGSYWLAETDADWLLLGDRPLTQADLDDMGAFAADYAAFGGVNGDRLYVSVLPNGGNQPRTGVVTLRAGSARATIGVCQYQYYETARLTAPDLGTSEADAPALPHGPLSLKWTSGTGGTGEYLLKLYEKTESGAYVKCYETSVTGALSAAIPMNVLTPGGQYRLWLGTVLAEDDYTGTASYFRVVGSQALIARVQPDWTGACIGGRITLQGSAEGGTGEYQYSYELLLDGKQLDITPWISRTYHSFSVTASGDYQVRVYVQDSAGSQVSALSERYSVDETITQTALLLTPDTWHADFQGGSVTLAVRAAGAWNAVSDSSWLTFTASGSGLTASVAANTGAERTGTLTVSCGSQTARFTVVQHAAPAGEAFRLSRYVWDMTSPASERISVSITAQAAWTITGMPDWLSATALSGSSTADVMLHASPNPGAARSAELTISSGGTALTLLVRQAGYEAAPAVTDVQISDDAPWTGSPVTFAITSLHADAVRILADGTLLAELPVNGDQVSYTRSFSGGGERQLQFIPLFGDIQGTPMSLTLSVQTLGKLDAPILRAPETLPLGDDLTVSWKAVANADSYTLHLYRGSERMLTREGIPQPGLTLDSTILNEAGAYTVLVMACGASYTQSQGAVIVNVVPLESIWTLQSPAGSDDYAIGDLLRVNLDNPAGCPLAVEITCGDTLAARYPQEGAVTETSLTFETQLTQGGDYRICVLTMSSDGSRLLSRQEALHIHADGPQINTSLSTIGGGMHTYTTSSGQYRIVTNRAVTRLTITGNGSDITVTPAEKTEDAHIFAGTMPALSEGVHRLGLVIEDDYGHTVSKTAVCYVCTPNNGEKTRYPVAFECTIQDIPGGKALDTPYPSDTIELLGWCGSYARVRFGDTTGYTLTDGFSTTRSAEWPDVSLVLTNKQSLQDVIIGNSVELYWSVSEWLPESTRIAVYVAPINAFEKKEYLFAAFHHERFVRFSTEGMKPGEYGVELQLQSADGQVTYCIARAANVFNLWTEDEYLAQTDTTFREDAARIKYAAQLLINAHHLFEDGVKDENEQIIADTPINPDRATGSWIGQTYHALLNGEYVDALGRPNTRAIYLAELLAGCYVDSTSWNPYITIDSIADFITYWLKVPDSVSIPLWQMLDEWKKGSISKISREKFTAEWTKRTHGEDTLSEWLTAGEIFFDVLSAASTLEQLSADDIRQLRLLADSLCESTNKTLELTGQYLHLICNGGGDLMMFITAAHCPATWTDFWIGKGSDLLTKWFGDKFFGCSLSVTIGMKTGVVVNDVNLNLNNVLSAAVRFKWSVEAARSYRETFENQLKFFAADPLHSYYSFQKACTTFTTLVQAEFKAYDDFLSALHFKPALFGQLILHMKNVADYDEYSKTLETLHMVPVSMLNTGMSNYLKYHIQPFEQINP